MIRRRELIRNGLLFSGALAFGPAFWREALAGGPAQPGPGPYGPLQAPDANGIMLPRGFSSRVIARGGAPVEGTAYQWHIFSDGQATYATPDGGWILVANSEMPPDLPGIGGQGQGGASAIRFRPDGQIADAYRILGGTSTNCAGGATPWGTWLSCEEFDGGRVWECDPTGQRPAVVRPAMGVFSHEAAAVDPEGRRIYLTEDDGEGRFYRFTPEPWPDLSAGLLEVATVGAGGRVTWTRVPDPSAGSRPTREQVPGSTRFRRGEGIWFDSGVVYIATTSDSRIHAYDARSEVMEVIYDAGALTDPPLTEVDNITVSKSGDLFVCEDEGGADPFDIAIITPTREVTRFLKLTGPQHGSEPASSEVAGVVFDPSGKRMYFSSQRAFSTGVVYEVSGPFRLERVAPAPPLQLAVDAPRSISIASFLRGGLPVTTRQSLPVRLDFTLRAALPARRSGSRGRAAGGRAAGGPRQTTLATASRSTAEAGRLLTRLRPSRGARDALRGRRQVRATLSVTAVTQAGQRRTVTRPVLLRGSARRVRRPGRRRPRRPRFTG